MRGLMLALSLALSVGGVLAFAEPPVPDAPPPMPGDAQPVPLQPAQRGTDPLPTPADEPASPPAFSAPRPNRKKRPLSLKLQARGSLSLVYQVGSTVQGSPEGERTFRTDYFGLTKTFSPFGALNWDWQIGNLRLQGDWTPFSYAPTARRLLAEYNAGSTKFTFGNLNLSLSGNTFVSFSRYAQGLQIKHQWGQRGDLTVVTFETPTRVITETFAGKNSPGPYFLRASPIVEGSEQVRVDERPLRRGVDYQIDYGYGQLMFSVPIPTTSTIAVRYETVGAGGVGRFWGARANWRVGANSLLGLSFLTQQVPVTVGGGATQHRRDEFRGNGTVGPFLLQTRPIVPGSEKVFVNGVQQIGGVHYRVDYQTGIVTFTQPVPAGALVAVEYDQALGPAAQIGALRLLGLDFSGRVPSLGAVSVQLGASQVGGQSGTAAEIALSNERPRFAYSLRWRRISSNFRRMESADFFRSESGLFADLRYDLRDGVTLTGSWQNTRSQDGLFFGLGALTANPASPRLSTNRILNLQLTVDRPKVPRLQLSHQRLANRFADTDSAKTLTTAYLSHQWGQLSVEGAWERSRDRVASAPSANPQSPAVTLATTTRQRFSLAYRPGSKVTALLDWSRNASDSPQQQFRSKATQRVVQLSYTPWQSLHLSLSHQRLSGGSSISALLAGTYLTGVAGGGLSGMGGGWGLGTGGWSTFGGGTGFGGYGTFGVTPPTSFGGMGPSGWGAGSGLPSGWGSPTPVWGETNASSPSRRRQLPLPLPQPSPAPLRSGGESRVTTLSAQWTPFARLSLGLDWTHNADKGSAEVGTLRQRTLSLNGVWQVSQHLSLFAQFLRDRVSDVSQRNESLSLMGSFGLTWGTPDGLNVTVSLQRMRLQTLRLGTPTPQLDENTYTALALSAQMPVAGRWWVSGRAAWFAQRASAGLYGGRFRNLELEAELTYRLNRHIGFSLIWTHTRRSGDQAAQNFRASLLRAALTANF